MLTKIITTAIAVVCLAGGTSAYYDVCYYSDTTCTTKIQCMTMAEDNAIHEKENVAMDAAVKADMEAEIARIEAENGEAVATQMKANMAQNEAQPEDVPVFTSCEEVFIYTKKNMVDDDDAPTTKSEFEACFDTSPKTECERNCKKNAQVPCNCETWPSRTIPGTDTMTKVDKSKDTGGVVYMSEKWTCTGSTAAKGDGVVKMETSAASNLIPANSKMFKMDDVSNIKAGDELTFGSGTKAEEKGTVKAVEKTRRSRRAATPGTVTLKEALKNEHVAGTTITWTPAAVPKSSAVTTTVGVGILAIVAALF